MPPPRGSSPQSFLTATEADDGGIADPLILTDLLFDPWAISKPGPLSLIADKLAAIAINAAPSKAHEGRFRRPKADQVERVSIIASSITANLYALHRGSFDGRRLALPLRHDALTRYDRAGFGHLPKVINAFAGARAIIRHPAVPRKRRTGIEATGWLLDALRTSNATRADLGRATGEETVWLSARAGRDRWGNKLPYVQIDYMDTAETYALRAETAAINRFLNTQRIELDGERQGDITLTRRFLLRDANDPHRFELHGRLYGAFWLSMPKASRSLLSINGEPIADLDFASMFPRLAYARAGVEPPQGDLYAVPGLEDHREGVKAGLSALLSTGSTMVRLPSKVKEALPHDWTASRFQEAIAAKHPALVPLFGCDIALDLMFTESRILVAALLDLMRQGVPALPMHDGMMVAMSKAKMAEAAMEKASLELVGKVIPVTRKEQPI